jgi:hypothetical protein
MSCSWGSNIYDGTCLSTGPGINGEIVGADVGIGAVASEVSDGPADPVSLVSVSSKERRSSDSTCEESGSCKDGLELHLNSEDVSWLFLCVGAEEEVCASGWSSEVLGWAVA